MSLNPATKLTIFTDVGGVGFVVNYDLTRNFENYIHRIGRSGRFGRKVVFVFSTRECCLVAE